MPQISVVMTTFNENKFVLERCIQSVLTQSFDDLEFIIVPGNPENIEALKLFKQIKEKDPRLKIVELDKKMPQQYCLNLAISKITGKYIANQEADDESVQGRFQKQFEFMESHPDIGVCSGGVSYRDSDSLKIIFDRFYPEQINEAIKRYSPVHNGPAFYRAELIPKYGNYEENTDLSAHLPDYELWMRWFTQGVVFYNIPEIFYYYYQSQDNGRNRNLKKTLMATIKLKERFRGKLDFNFKDDLYILLEKTLYYFVPSIIISKLFYVYGKLIYKK